MHINSTPFSSTYLIINQKLSFKQQLLGRNKINFTSGNEITNIKFKYYILQLSF